MSLTLGDHLIISRDGKVLGPEDEAYHEFEVIEQPEYAGIPPEGYQSSMKEIRPFTAGYLVRLKVIA